MALPVAFLSDVEGSLAKLTDFCARHEAFERGADGRSHLRDGWIFVHGGDAPDRFLGSMGVVDELLRLKQEAPGRVVLIAGNRDVNKLRLPLELSDPALARDPIDLPQDWRNSIAAEMVAAGERASEPEVTADDRRRWTTRPRRLRWIFRRTMGAAEAFELRRRELTTTGQSPSDDDVVDSFLTDLGPGGRFRRFLEASCLLFREGNTLYTHAGLTEENLCLVPGRGRVESVDEWIGQTNAWYLAQLAEWRDGAGRWPASGDRPGEALIQYCQPRPTTKVNQASVVYSRNADEQGKIALPADAVVARIVAQGIRRVAVGHTPSGDVPVVLRTPDDAFELVVADTSRSTDADSACLVTVEGGAQDAVFIRSGPKGVAGHPVAFRARLGDPSPLGKRRPDGALVVAPLPDGYLTYQLGPGWKVIYSTVASG